MSKGIVRLICITDEKVVSLLLDDCFMNFDYEYTDEIQTYDLEFKLPYNNDRHEVIKSLYHNNTKTRSYLSCAGRLFHTYSVSFRLSSNDLSVDESRPEGHIVLNSPLKFREYSGNVEGFYSDIRGLLEVK